MLQWLRRRGTRKREPSLRVIVSESDREAIVCRTHKIGVRRTRLIRETGLMLCPPALIGGTREIANSRSLSDRYLAFVLPGVSGK